MKNSILNISCILSVILFLKLVAKIFINFSFIANACAMIVFIISFPEIWFKIKFIIFGKINYRCLLLSIESIDYLIIILESKNIILEQAEKYLNIVISDPANLHTDQTYELIKFGYLKYNIDINGVKTIIIGSQLYKMLDIHEARHFKISGKIIYMLT
jgi:hypothetical protein